MNSILASIVMLLELPSLAEFMDNPLQTMTEVLTSSFGVFGYIVILLALIVIVFSYTRNSFSVGIFIVLYGVVADVLYPPVIAIIINLLAIGIIFGGVIYKGVFSDD